MYQLRKEIDDNAFVCIHCGCKTQQTVQPAAPARKQNPLCIAGFVLSLLSIWFGAFFAICPIVALILSAVGIKQANVRKQSNGLGIAGLIMSIFWTLIYVMIWTIVLIAILSGNPIGDPSGPGTYAAWLAI